jgi:Rod binding domain-containing protein
MEEGRRLMKAKAEEKIDEYASFFVNQMMRAMRATVQPGGLVSRGRGEQLFQGELDLQFSSQMAKSLRFGKAFGPALERLGRPRSAGIQAGSQGA